MTDTRTILRSRWLLCALLVLGAALFGIGVAAERHSNNDHHATETISHTTTTPPGSSPHAEGGDTDGGEPTTTSSVATGDGDANTGETTHSTGGATTVTAAGVAVVHNEATETSGGETSEKVLGVNLESTPLVAAAILISIALGIATIFKPKRILLAVTAVFAAVFCIFDTAEAIHQFNVSKPGIAVIAIAVAAIHLAASIIAVLWTIRPLTTKHDTRVSSAGS